ncbi:uncharacterized protein LOC118433856 [Folsomia candida]|uniref:uncharacterized protein LOC118433856 n=1 Tax=Folsomia candida TaxID=158441 RepID=UPI00160501BB|nr:uncharacterized protein LOC118433856 [Folsomia candida]
MTVSNKSIKKSEHCYKNDSKLFLKVYTTLSLIASNFDPISGIELPPGSARVLQPWECAYLVDLKSNTTLHTIYEGWQSTPNYFRSERSTLSKSVFYPSTWIPKKECNITICGLEFGERYGCKDVTEWGGNLSTSGVGYEIHTTKCVCEDGIPCRTNCSNNGFGDPKICATLYSEPNCWDCRHVGISVEFDSSLVLHGSDLVKVAQFQSFRLRHGCTMQILYLDENANILEQMEDKYPWSTDWKLQKFLSEKVDSVIYSCICNCDVINDKFNDDFIKNWTCQANRTLERKPVEVCKVGRNQFMKSQSTPSLLPPCYSSSSSLPSCNVSGSISEDVQNSKTPLQN